MVSQSGNEGVGAVKALIADPVQRVALCELFMAETSRVIDAIGHSSMRVDLTPLTTDVFRERVITIVGSI